jgi:EAL domain-containing protein (putative c-di-GMP-specific phosphodiesterase class I)/GAF domain-containing protein
VLDWENPNETSAIPNAVDAATGHMERARVASGCERAILYWHIEERNVLIPLMLTDDPRATMLPVAHPGQGIVGAAFATREGTFVEGGYPHSVYAHTFGLETGVQSAFAIPLRAGNRMLGILAGGSPETLRFDTETREALGAIGDEIVRAFANVAPILMEAQINRTEYGVVSSLIRNYTTDADFGLTCSRITAVAMTLLGVDYAVISRQEPDLSHTYHGARATRSTHWAAGMASSTPRTRVADDLLDAGEIVIVGTDEMTLPDSGYEHSLAEDAQTVMLVPISINRHRIGILIVGWRVPVQVSGRLHHLAQTLAGHAAIAIAESQRLGVFSGNAIEARRADDSIARRLNAALARGDIGLEYQPIFDAKTGEVAMLEALARWPGAPAGYERPDQFVLFAEDRGIIGALTDYVIARAASEWHELKYLGAKIAINVSMRNFEEPSFAKRALETFARFDIAPQNFGIELTETSRMIDRKNAVITARKLTFAGMTLTIDDFGEGYAALSYLKTFRATSLKIDRRYVTSVAKDSYDFTIVRSVTELAHSLGVSVVAEGIETIEGLEVVRTLGCDLLQGYACARPMTISQLHAFFA